MKRLFGFLFAIAVGIVGLAAPAQTGDAKPACAAGDTVVWENTSTKVYHLPGDKYFGNTKHGAYACRSTADSAGYHLAGQKNGSKTSGSMTSAESHYGKHHHKSGATPTPAPSPATT